jgi:hypothetical protein
MLEPTTIVEGVDEWTALTGDAVESQPQLDYVLGIQ